MSAIAKFITSGSYKFTSSISLAVIAACFVVQILHDYAVPNVLFFVNSNSFREAAIACELAKQRSRSLERDASSYASYPITAGLLKSIEVQMMSCFEYKKLEMMFLANGVSQSKLEHVRLTALNDRRISVSHALDQSD